MRVIFPDGTIVEVPDPFTGAYWLCCSHMEIGCGKQHNYDFCPTCRECTEDAERPENNYRIAEQLAEEADRADRKG